MQTEDENRERRIEARSFMHYKKSIAPPSLPIHVTPVMFTAVWAPTLFERLLQSAAAAFGCCFIISSMPFFISLTEGSALWVPTIQL